jgi:hypothetical protein
MPLINFSPVRWYAGGTSMPTRYVLCNVSGSVVALTLSPMLASDGGRGARGPKAEHRLAPKGSARTLAAAKLCAKRRDAIV